MTTTDAASRAALRYAKEGADAVRRNKPTPDIRDLATIIREEYARAQAQPAQGEARELARRLMEIRRRIGKMCDELRPPRMSVPALPTDDDVFIANAADEAAALLTAQAAEIERLTNALAAALEARNG